MKIVHALLLVCLLLTACSKRDQGATIVDYAGTDFDSLSAAAYEKAAKKLGPILGQDYQAGAGPKLLQSFGSSIFSLWQDGNSLTLDRFTSTGHSVWQVPIDLGLSVTRFAIAPSTDFDQELVLSITCDGKAGQATVLHFVLLDDGPFLVRSTDHEGVLANVVLSQDHPQLVVQAGNVGGTRIEKLAAMVYFARHTAELGKASVRSHLNDMASGNDVWLAQAAAELLTLADQ